MTGGRRLAAAGLAAAYGWTVARYRREQADGLSARDLPPAGSPELVRFLEDAGVAHSFRPPRWHSIGDADDRVHRRQLVVARPGRSAVGVGIADVWTGDAEDPW